MRKQSLLLLVMAISCLALLLSGCMEKFVEPTAKTENKKLYFLIFVFINKY